MKPNIHETNQIEIHLFRISINYKNFLKKFKLNIFYIFLLLCIYYTN
jgi:hypothetical protein